MVLVGFWTKIGRYQSLYSLLQPFSTDSGIKFPKKNEILSLKKETERDKVGAMHILLAYIAQIVEYFMDFLLRIEIRERFLFKLGFY